MGKPRGDWRQLEKIIAGAGRVASGALIQKSVKTFGSVSYELARRGAAAGTNPQGRRWKPLKRGGRALAGAAGSLSLKTRRTGFTIESSHSKLRFHQYGARRRGTKWKLPARRILPKKSLPKQWREPIVEKLREEWFGNFDKRK